MPETRLKAPPAWQEATRVKRLKSKLKNWGARL